MSVNELSNQTNVYISEQTIASGGYGNIGAEGIKPMELHVCALGEDANNETKEVGISVSRTRRTRQLTEKGKQYQINLLLDKRTKMVERLQRKARAIDDLLYSSSNHVAIKEELQQYSDLFKFLSTQHQEYCELLGLMDQGNEVAWFDDLDLDVFDFKHKIHSWLRDSADKSSCKASKSSRSIKSSSSSKSSTKLKMLKEKVRIAKLEAEGTFLLEKQKTENQAKMLQLEGEVVRAKTRTRGYEDYNQMEVNSEVDEVESNVYEEKVQKRCRHKDQGQENLRANAEDNKSYFKVVSEEKKSKSLAGGRSKAI